eukprot:gene13858-13980_t
MSEETAVEHLRGCLDHVLIEVIYVQRCMPLRTLVRARKQTEKQDVAPSLDQDVVGLSGLPADISKLTKLTKSDLRHELEVRGLDHHGDKQEMADRLLNSLIAQESAVAATPTSRDVLEQQLQKEADQAAANRRGRRGSRTGTTSLDAQAAAIQPAVHDSTTADTGADNAEGAKARRGRKPSRRPSSIMADPGDAEQHTVAASPAIRSARRSSRRTGVVDAAEPNAGSIAPASPGHTPKRGGRSTASTASTLQDVPAAAEPLSDVSAVSSASASVSRAKQLAQRLARQEISTHPVHKPVNITAATTAAATVAAVTSSAVTSSPIEASPAAADTGDNCSSADLLHGNSQAQSDTLLLGATDSMASDFVQGAPDAPSSTVTGSLEAVLAQVAAESTAGLVDEMQLPTDDHSPYAPTEHSVGLADIAAAGDAAEVIGSLSEAPLQVAQLPDAALDAFDHIVMPPSAASSVGLTCTAADVADASAKHPHHSLVQEKLGTGIAEQHPTLAEIVASAAEASRDGASSPLEEDEEADVVLSAFDSFMTQDVASPQAADMAEQHPTLADIAAAVLEGRHSPLEEDEEADVALTAFDHMDYVADCSDKALATLQLPHPLAAGGDGSVGDVAQSHGLSALVIHEEIDVGPVSTVGDADSAASPALQTISASAAAPSGSNGISGVLQSWWAAILQLFEEWKNALSGK